MNAPTQNGRAGLPRRRRAPFAGLRLCAFAFILILSAVNCSAAQQAWVANYSNGPGSTNRATGIAVDPNGNILVAGTSSDSIIGDDYVLIKYSPLGSTLWARRFASAGTASDELRGFVVDEAGNAFLTGTSQTVMYDSGGTVMWSRPYAGRALAVDEGHVYVTGFSNAYYATVKLAKDTGSNVWSKIHPGQGQSAYTYSQAITLDSKTNIFVSGKFVCRFFSPGVFSSEPYTFAYDSSGNDLWLWPGNSPCVGFDAQVKGMVTDAAGNLYLTATSYLRSMFWTLKFNNSGSALWSHSFDNGLADKGVNGLAQDPRGSVYACGISLNGTSVQATLIKIDSVAGTNLWVRRFTDASSEAEALQLDLEGNIYLTGYARPPVPTVNYDYLTLKYNPQGQLQWSKRYDLANSYDSAKAIAVDGYGNVYVTGQTTTASGLTQITTIKYVQVAPIEKKSNGNVLLQFPGAPGSNYVIQASTNFPSWSTIGNSTADSSGIYRFEDTNAPAYPSRFYRVEP